MTKDKFVSRKPDLVIKALDKVTEAKSGRIGVAWINKDGTLTISIDPGCALTYHNDIVYTAFPNDANPRVIDNLGK